MLQAAKEKSRRIEKIERRDDCLFLYAQKGTIRLEPVDGQIVRVSYTENELFSKGKKPGMEERTSYSAWTYTESESEICMRMEQLQVIVSRESGSCCYLSEDGRVLLKERSYDSKILEQFDVFTMSEEGAKIEKVKTPDGVKEVVREAGKVLAGTSYHTRLYLEWEDEALYGLGQHEEGFGSLRGQTVFIHQANRKIAVPFLVSTKGYGILMDTYSPMIFQDTVYGSYLYTEADPEMDFYVINGKNMDGAVAGYRRLTGKAAMLPKWAFGYIQSQERYETADEIEQVVQEYRKRGLGLDGIVLDWCSWEGEQWGQKTFDSKRFPDPAGMIERLHEKHVHFMLSIWPNMAELTDNYKEFKENKLLLPGCTIYNALSEEGRRLYWEQVERGLHCHGVDAWWCDSSEPFTPEWNHKERVEPSRMYEEYCQTSGMHLPAEQMNAYSFYHAQGIFEGQRNSKDPKRVVNLTRSGYTGMQRFGTIFWSGDIAATWDTFRRQIGAGLLFSASGLPYWTVDIGAFFVKKGDRWFWKGDYENGPADPAYRELFVRWYQWACFLPVFRGHGTDFSRLLWEFGTEEDAFYQALKKMNRLRYQLMPYIYSAAGKAWLQDASMMKLLSFVYSEDKNVWNITDQYLFGEALMVCPVVTAARKDGRQTRRVYLPAGNGWYDFWTGKYLAGGQYIEAEAPLETIPVYVKEGSILPCCRFAQSAEEISDELIVSVYPGKDGSYLLYDDSGDGYGYEKGEFQLIQLNWNEKNQELTVLRTKECSDRKIPKITVRTVPK